MSKNFESIPLSEAGVLENYLLIASYAFSEKVINILDDCTDGVFEGKE